MGGGAENYSGFQKHLQVFCRNETSVNEISFALWVEDGSSACKVNGNQYAEVFKSVTLNVAQPSSVLWRTKLCKQCNERIRHIPTFRTDNVPSY